MVTPVAQRIATPMSMSTDSHTATTMAMTVSAQAPPVPRMPTVVALDFALDKRRNFAATTSVSPFLAFVRLRAQGAEQ